MTVGDRVGISPESPELHSLQGRTGRVKAVYDGGFALLVELDDPDGTIAIGVTAVYSVSVSALGRKP